MLLKPHIFVLKDFPERGEVRVEAMLQTLAERSYGRLNPIRITSHNLIPKLLPKDRDPHKAEVAEHRHKWTKRLGQAKPDLILCLGKTAAWECVLGLKGPKSPINLRVDQHKAWWFDHGDPAIRGDLLTERYKLFRSLTPLRITWHPNKVSNQWGEPRLQDYYYEALYGAVEALKGGS